MTSNGRFHPRATVGGSEAFLRVRKSYALAILSQGLTGRARDVFEVIRFLELGYPDQEGGWHEIGGEEFAELCLCSRPTVRHALAQLVRKRLIEVQPGGSGQGNKSSYRTTDPAGWSNVPLRARAWLKYGPDARSRTPLVERRGATTSEGLVERRGATTSGKTGGQVSGKSLNSKGGGDLEKGEKNFRENVENRRTDDPTRAPGGKNGSTPEAPPSSPPLPSQARQAEPSTPRPPETSSGGSPARLTSNGSTVWTGPRDAYGWWEKPCPKCGEETRHHDAYQGCEPCWLRAHPDVDELTTEQVNAIPF